MGFLTSVFDLLDPCGTEGDGEDYYYEVAYVSNCSTVLGTGSYRYECQDDGTVVLKMWTNEDCSGDALSSSSLNDCLTANDCAYSTTNSPTNSSHAASGTDGAMEMTVKGVFLVVMASFLY